MLNVTAGTVVRCDVRMEHVRRGCLVRSISGFVTVTDRVSEELRKIVLIMSDPPNSVMQKYTSKCT